MTKSSNTRLYYHSILYLTISIFCAILYILPIRSSQAPVLDELFIIDTRGEKKDDPNIINNADVMGTSNINDLFQNDFWGKSLFANESHKSWRPFTILTFRYLNSLSESKFGLFRGIENVLPVTTMFIHRFVSILIHTLLSDMVALTGHYLFPPINNTYQSILQYNLIKLFFALHPCHIETVVNVANRGHILGLLASIYACLGLQSNNVIVLIASIIGLLSSETTVFQLPAIIVTISILSFRKKKRKQTSIRQVIFKYILPQSMIPISTTLAYLIIRYKLNTLSIPEIMIKKAENPFYHFVGWKRFINYSYITSIHIMKGVGIDMIGFSHEYGYDCISSIESLYDLRIILPLSIILILLFSMEIAYRKTLYNDFQFIIILIFLLSWMATLFPITGIYRVGTFVADRIVLPFTFATTVLLGKITSEWILHQPNTNLPNTSNSSKKIPKQKIIIKTFMVFSLILFMSKRVYHRSLDWMRSETLFQSSLVTCPRYAKANLQLSKVYSGTVQGMIDLEKSLFHVQAAENLDQDYCEVNYQFALIYFLQQKYDIFEKRLVKAIICLPTYQKAYHLWAQYWPVMIDPQNGYMSDEAIKRKTKYEHQIYKAYEKQNKLMEQQHK